MNENQIAFQIRGAIFDVFNKLGAGLYESVYEKAMIIELKSVEHLQEVHHKQIITYLKLTGLKLGILVNFNCVDIKANIIRKVNGL